MYVFKSENHAHMLTCLQGTGSKLDGSFLATLLETFSVYMLFIAWTSITEGK